MFCLGVILLAVTSTPELILNYMYMGLIFTKSNICYVLLYIINKTVSLLLSLGKRMTTWMESMTAFTLTLRYPWQTLKQYTPYSCY